MQGFTGPANFGGSGGKRWSQGDFNFDGSANTIDFNLLASNFGSTLPSGSGAALVPEPVSSTWIIVTGILTCRIRRLRLSEREDR